MKPLYGHTSPETAYLVTDYPYGRLRCKMRYWLEFKPGQGFRLVSQTTNPKKPFEVWNKPHPSTYAKFAACMYLDEKEHCVWTGIGIYDSGAEVASFIERFPGADLHLLVEWVRMKLVYHRLGAAGRVEFAVNGVGQGVSEADIERHRGDFADWHKAMRGLVDAKAPGALELAEKLPKLFAEAGKKKEAPTT